MLHAAPTSETKADTTQGKTQVAPQPERELHPHLLNAAGRYSSGGTGDVSGALPTGQQRHALAGMQQTRGNQAVLRMRHGSQQVARIAPLRPSQGVMLQRKCACGGSAEGECAECKAKSEGALQRKGANSPVSPAAAHGVPPVVHDVLRSSGQPLDAGTRAFMEPRFGHDFSQVRVHTDARAAESARAVNAVAYTVGKDVVFGDRQYIPETGEGKRLLAHELTHTIQQDQGDQTSLQARAVSNPNDISEMEAKSTADKIVETDEILTSTPSTMPIRSRLALPTVQRELLAYKSEHTETLPTASPDVPVTTTITYKAAAAEIKTALQALITANKVGIFDDSQKVFFINRGVDRSELLTAFIAAGYPKAGDMTDALLDNHNVSVYSGEEVTRIEGLIPVTVDKRSQVVERQTERLLTDFEKSEARQVFGNSLNIDSITVVEDPVMSIGGFARTPYNTIYFPLGSFNSSNFMPWLIHELTHSWQSQHGISVVTKLYHALFSSYDYQYEKGIKAAQSAGKKFTDFNTEQQGDILEDYYKRLKAGIDVSAWQPFVDQVNNTR